MSIHVEVIDLQRVGYCFVRWGLLIQIYQSFYRNEKCQFSVRSVLGTLHILHKQLANELNDYVLL